MGMISNAITNITTIFTNTIINIFDMINWFVGDYTISLLIAVILVYTPIVFIVTKLILTKIYSPYKIAFVDIFISVLVGSLSVNEFSDYYTQLKITVFVLSLFFIIGNIARFLMEPLFSGILNRKEDS